MNAPLPLHEQWRQELQIPTGWTAQADGWWLDAAGVDPRRIASLMLDAGARLATISAVDRGAEATLFYHWDLEGILYTWAVETVERHIAGIRHLTAAAEWVEREIADYYAIQILPADAPTLMLQGKIPPGVFALHPGEGEQP